VNAIGDKVSNVANQYRLRRPPGTYARGYMAERLEAPLRGGKHQDLELVALEVPAEHIVVQGGLESLHLPREAAQRQRTHIDLDQRALDVAIRVGHLEVRIGQEWQPVLA
jgi:hypothetical protein